MKRSRKYQSGFTFIEIIAVLVIVGIISAVVISRNNDMDASLHSEAEVIKVHLRYSQTQAMNKTTLTTNSTPELVWGIKYSGGNYWLFRGTNPDTQAKIMALPDNAVDKTTRKLSLTTKKVDLTWNSPSTVFFDGRGVPYTRYVNATNNDPVTLANTLTITVKPMGKASPSETIDITPLTGYIP